MCVNMSFHDQFVYDRVNIIESNMIYITSMFYKILYNEINLKHKNWVDIFFI